MIIRAALVALLVLLAAACGGSSESYTADEARAAFQANGYPLVDPPVDPSGSALNVWESEDVVVLVPGNGAQFFVFVGDADAAGDLWEVYAGGGAPRFDEREANVRVMAADELQQADADKVRAALAALSG